MFRDNYQAYVPHNLMYEFLSIISRSFREEKCGQIGVTFNMPRYDTPVNMVIPNRS